MQNRGAICDLVNIYPGNYRKTTTTNQLKQKVIIFDLDETLGHFSDMVSLWNAIHLTKSQRTFNFLLDQYPEFLRYGILTILEYLYHKKRSGKCYKLYLYTNNKYSPEIPLRIAKYFDYKMGIFENEDNLHKTYLFDQVICAFKIGNHIIEPRRTTHKKTHGDFIRCTLLPKHTEICFVDDTYHKDMNHRKIYYIQPQEYYHNLKTDVIIHRACAFMPDVYSVDYLQYLFSDNENSRTDHNETNIQISQKLMYYIKEFFFLSSIQPKTKKSKSKLGKYTRKK